MSDNDKSIVPGGQPDSNAISPLDGLIIGVDIFISIPDKILVPLVIGELDRLIAADTEFSAWNITENLRAANPTLNIVQGRVRNIVHDEMNERISNGLDYTSEYDSLLGPIGATIYKKDVVTIVAPDPNAPAQPPAATNPVQKLIGLLFNWNKE